MTEPKREPFVRVAEVHSLNYGVLLSDRMARGHYGPKTSMERFVEDLNAAFNKRLDEEIKKAVVDFREKCLDIVLGDCYGLVTDEREAAHNADIVAIAEKIRDLPTEPEAK